MREAGGRKTRECEIAGTGKRDGIHPWYKHCLLYDYLVLGGKNPFLTESNKPEEDKTCSSNKEKASGRICMINAGQELNEKGVEYGPSAPIKSSHSVSVTAE